MFEPLELILSCSLGRLLSYDPTLHLDMCLQIYRHIDCAFYT